MHDTNSKLKLHRFYSYSIDFLSPILQLERFVELRAIIDELAKTDASLFVLDEEWETIKLIVKILHKPFRVTELLQKVNYTLSDFYAAWLQLKLYFGNLASKKNELAQCLSKAMNAAKHCHLLENPLLLCSVFLDPRVKGILLKDRGYEDVLDEIMETQLLV